MRPVRGRIARVRHDEPEKQAEAIRVLKENHVAAVNYILKTGDHDAFAEALDKEWPGPVRYTLVVAPGGRVVYRKVGAIDPLEVKRAIVSHLGRTY